MWSGALHSYCYYLAPECDKEHCTVTVIIWHLNVVRRTAQSLLLPGTWMWSGALHSYCYYLAPERGQENCTVTVTTWHLNVIRELHSYCYYLAFECDPGALHSHSGGGWGCEVSCGGHHRPRGKNTTGSALDGAVFDIAQILAYLIHNMSRSQLYLGFGHFGWLPFFGQ